MKDIGRNDVLVELGECLKRLGEILIKSANDITNVVKENEQMKHSDAKQDKKLINKIVDKKLARVTRSDKRSDAKMLKRVVKKPKR